MCDDFLEKHSAAIGETFEKVVAVLRLILNNDKHAAQLALLGLISRVHKREAGMLLGDLSLNLSGINPEQAALLK